MELFLGTALWGWGVEEREAHSLLDLFYERGGRRVDAAVNYPINGDPDAFGLANRYISRWLKANPAAEMSIYLKIGAVDNSGSPRTALTPTDMLLSVELAGGLFGERLWGLAIHWDNSTDAKVVSETAGTLAELHQTGFEIGFSGIAEPDLYAAALRPLSDRCWIQVKENAATNKARQHYLPHFPDANYLAYGINMGGFKLKEAEETSSVSLRHVAPPAIVERVRDLVRQGGLFQPAPTNMNAFALALTWSNPALTGVILGPRRVDQLTASLDYLDELDASGERGAIHAAIRQQLWD